MGAGAPCNNIELQPPPHDVEAERAFLGAMVFGRDDDRIERHHFYLAAHRIVFDSLARLKADGVPFDAVTLARALKDDGRLDEAGGLPTIYAILETVPHANHIRHYADAILSNYKRRLLREHGSRLLRAAYDSTSDHDAIAQGINLDVAGGRSRTSALLTPLADIESVPIRWLWPGRIARGKITLIAGEPKLGKSLLTVDLAARVSQGWPWPDGAPGGEPGDVIMLSAEDDPADTIRAPVRCGRW